MSIRYLQDVIFTCGHVTTRPVRMEQRHRQGSIYKAPNKCRACQVLDTRDEYVRELQVRAAFESEAG